MARTWVKLVAGLAGGALATWAMRRSLPLAGRLPERLRPPTPRQDPGERMVRVGERLLGHALPRKVHTAAVQGLPWAYGISWPLALAAVSGALGLRTPGRTLAAGAALGAVVWAAGYAGWLPALGLLPPLGEVDPRRSATSLASHAAWGALAALPLALESRAQA
jgi:hypothetical protein